MANISFQANVGQVHGLKFSNDGKPRFSFSAAENHSRFDKQTNSWVEIGTSWYDITVFGKKAEDLADVIQSGIKQSVVVSGRMVTREYDRKDGTKGSSLDVLADNVGVVHRAAQGQPQPPQASTANSWGAPAADPWAGSGQGQAPNF